ncbi:MAG: YceI family protein [Sphingobacteriaceae bacterium]|nr:YceI family protein [Sphingobacteriaceae bacterium]
MKLKITLFSLAAFVAFSAFKTPKKETETYKVDVAKSTITWLGKKLTGSHTGVVKLKSGVLIYEDQKLAGGNFVADMNTIKNTDDSGESLDKHLKDDDFFGVAKFPTAKFEIKSVSKGMKNYVVGDLTIKGITKSITFETFLTYNPDGTITIVADKVGIDRTKFGIKYKSKSVFTDIGDKFIEDEFELSIKLVAKKQA